jgi:RNA polymerase sigma-70 factor (ECF subfamily)
VKDTTESRGRAAAGAGARRQEVAHLTEATPFDEQFIELFESHFPRLHRIMDRLSGDAELAADVVQDAFMRLYQRGSLPDRPEAWLITVALNRFRSERTTRARRLRLLTPARGEVAIGDAPPTPEQAASAAASQQRVRSALDRLPERQRHLLLLHAEGYRYHEIAAALELNATSVGVMLARARRAFRAFYETPDAP